MNIKTRDLVNFITEINKKISESDYVIEICEKYPVTAPIYFRNGLNDIHNSLIKRKALQEIKGMFVEHFDPDKKIFKRTDKKKRNCSFYVRGFANLGVPMEIDSATDDIAIFESSSKEK